MNPKRVILSACLVILSTFVSGCGSSPSTQPQSVMVSVSSSSSSVLLGNTQQLTATVTGTSNTAVNWSVNGVAGGNSTLGTITNAGVYTAPADLPNPTNVKVQATSQADNTASGSISITIASDITVAVSTVPSSVQSLAADATLQLDATITSAGHPDQTVTWTVNGVLNGNPTAGTIATSGTNTAIYTAPSPTATALNVTIEAISVADSTKNSSVQFAVNFVPLGVTSVSNTSPTSLTPLNISTAGLNVNGPVSVQFSNSSGFSVTGPPIRVASDGTVVATVPLYIDPSTGQVGANEVSIVLTQGAQSSDPVTINIQELPTVNSYGTQLGQISHAFLTYAEMRAARRLGELQAFEELPGNTVDTSQAQANLQTLLTALIESRSDVDRVSLNNSLVISGGTLANGTPIQFDQNSLDMMDRVIGLYLTQLGSIYSIPATSSALESSSRQSFHRQASSKFAPAKRRPLAPFMVSREQANSGGLSAVLAFLTNVDSLNSVTQEFLPAFTQDTTLFDKVQALVTGSAALYAMASGTGTLAQQVAGLALGTLLPAVHLLDDFAMELYDLGQIMVASASGNDPAVLQAAQADINSRAADASNALLQTELNLATVGIFGGYGSAVYESFVAAQATGVALQSALLIDDIVACVQLSSEPCYTLWENAAVSLAAEVKSVFGSATQGFGQVTGLATISNSQGTTLAGDTGIEISPFDVTSSDMTALSDPNGNYDLFISLQAPNSNYASLTLSAFDPVSGLVLSSATVDLSGLNTSAPLVLPTLQGTCTDSDAGSPDADDPDCD